jgi:hypothetical protein
VISRIDDLAGPPEPPSRIHGDCWSGNVLWSGGRGWLIDPAAHGGHRETDLAMLALFGAPHLDHILRGYHDAHPLADGWPARPPGPPAWPASLARPPGLPGRPRVRSHSLPITPPDPLITPATETKSS